MARTTIKSVRVCPAAWAAFEARCKEIGTNPNAALAEYISSGVTQARPTPKKPVKAKPQRRIVGYHPITNDPIYEGEA